MNQESKANKANEAPDSWPTEGWRTCSPALQGLDEEVLMTMLAYMNKQMPKVNSLLIVKNGRLVFEQYFNGCTKHDLADILSATKSFTATLIGAALNDGLLDGLDAPISSFIGSRIPDRPNGGLAAGETSLRQLLTMSSGFHWTTGKRLGEPYVHRMHRSRSWIDFILRLPIDGSTRGRFQYRSADSHLLAAVLAAASGESVFAYAYRKLFRPLGIERVAWPADPQGINAGHVFLRISPRDMAKLGFLYLHNGQWDGQQIVSRAWVAAATTTQSEGLDLYGTYGYHWWVLPSERYTGYYALGHGGQSIIVIPELELIVVTTASPKVSRYKHPKELLDRFILPSITRLSR